MAARVLPTWLWILAVGGCRGCGCVPDLPNEPDEEDTGDTAETDTADSAVTESGETGEEPCPWPEIEPNDALSAATPLGLDKVGCGIFDEPGDADSWAFMVPEDTTLTCDGLWLGVRVEAQHIGSKADVALTLSSELGEAAQILDLPEEIDPELLFPARADVYTAILVEEAGDGGEGYEYEILATRQKSPICWDERELEGAIVDPNDPNPLDLQPVDGAATPTYTTEVFGWIDDTVDQDWYGFIVPEGKHTVTAEIIAASEGSAGDFKMTVETCEWNFSLGACRDEPITKGFYYVGEHGWEIDPYLSESSEGDERWSIRIADQNDRSGQAYWYLLRVTLEE